jgi:nucleoside-diphosphate-sugar epimerase
MKDVNILVTGATSQIGIFLLPLFVEKGFNVIALSRTYTEESRGVTWLKGDLESIDSDLLNKMDVHTVIHLAEITLINNIIKDTSTIKRVIAFSSTSVLTKLNSKCESDKKLATDLIFGENLMINSCKLKSIEYTIFRPTMIYGANVDKNIAFISKFMSNYGFFPIIGNAESLRQPVHASDLANACILAINQHNSFGKIYNLVGPETIKYIDMIQKISNSLNKKIVLIKVNKFIFTLAVAVLRILPQYRHLSVGMVDRLEQNLCFDSEDAKKDFNYNPVCYL